MGCAPSSGGTGRRAADRRSLKRQLSSLNRGRLFDSEDNSKHKIRISPQNGSNQRDHGKVEQGKYGHPKIVFMGLDGSGKTSLVHRLVRIARPYFKWTDRVASPPPTRRIKETTLEIDGVKFVAIDTPGRSRYRADWLTEEVFSNVTAVVFVVDACDTARFPLVHQHLRRLTVTRALVSLPILVLVNKQDVPGAWRPSAVNSALSLSSVLRNGRRMWAVAGCSATPVPPDPTALPAPAALANTAADAGDSPKRDKTRKPEQPGGGGGRMVVVPLFKSSRVRPEPAREPRRQTSSKVIVVANKEQRAREARQAAEVISLGEGMGWLLRHRKREASNTTKATYMLFRSAAS